MAVLAAAALLQAAAPRSTIATPPRLLSGAPSSSDYPPSALARGEQGMTRAGFLIRPDGTATRCRIVGSSGHASLDALACRIIVTRARFAPALDAEGHAMTSEAVLPVNWIVGD